MHDDNKLNRRQFLGRAAALAGGMALGPGLALAQEGVNINIDAGHAAIGAAAAVDAAAQRYRIAVCDWMILKRQKLGEFKRAHEIGADGIELDMGGLGQRETFDNQLADPAQLKVFMDERAKYGLEICSIAMSGFYAQSYAERETVPRMEQDTLDLMTATNTRVAFLPLGVKGDLVAHPELRPAIVERLRAFGKKAEALGKIIGIETALDAAGEIKLLEEIGSPAIRIYFNLANPIRAKRDVHEELKTLGTERICQIHFSNTDGQWLENDPAVDVPAIKATLDAMGWNGWLVVERSRDATRTGANDVVWNYGANVRYLKSVFQA